MGILVSQVSFVSMVFYGFLSLQSPETQCWDTSTQCALIPVIYLILSLIWSAYFTLVSSLLVKGFTLLCPTWAALDGGRFVATSLWIPPEVWANEVRQEDLEWVGMNLVVIKEHQVGDLVFAQVYYLYILLEATSAYFIVPIAKVPRT